MKISEMMSVLNEFIEFLETELKNGSVYVLGAQGQRYPFSDDWLEQREHNNQSNISRVKATVEKRIKDGYPPEKIGAFDCSGLGMYWLQNVSKLFPADLNANGMRGKCKAIDKASLRKGDWVFIVDGGRATHIGYIVDDELNVIESRGRDYGVVKTKLASRPWNDYGRPDVFAREINPPVILTRKLKKGDKGDDVKAVQQALITNKYSLPKYGADGSFGNETDAAVRTLQSENGLTVDGIVDKEEVEMLGLAWDYKDSYEELLADMLKIKAIADKYR